MEILDIFDLKNTSADRDRLAIAMAASQLLAQGGRMTDRWRPANGTAKYGFESPWDGGIDITIIAMWPKRTNTVEYPVIGVSLAKQTRPHKFSPVVDLHYGLHISQHFNDAREIERTTVSPLLSQGIMKRRSQRQKAGHMAQRLVRDFPASGAISTLLISPLELDR